MDIDAIKTGGGGGAGVTLQDIVSLLFSGIDTIRLISHLSTQLCLLYSLSLE